MKLLYAMLWLSIICILSVIPIDSENRDIGNLLDLGHTIVYAVQTILWAWFFNSKNRFIVVSIASSPLTELLQLVVSWRDPCLMDVFNNLIGVALGFTVVFTIELCRRFRVSL